jgi:hypothetical protein
VLLLSSSTSPRLLPREFAPCPACNGEPGLAREACSPSIITAGKKAGSKRVCNGKEVRDRWLGWMTLGVCGTALANQTTG